MMAAILKAAGKEGFATDLNMMLNNLQTATQQSAPGLMLSRLPQPAPVPTVVPSTGRYNTSAAAANVQRQNDLIFRQQAEIVNNILANSDLATFAQQMAELGRSD